MKRFKVKQGPAEIFDISRDEYEKQTKLNRKYHEKGKDGELRSFAICPACDNPIQILGLYKKLKNTEKPYGKHYCRSISIAPHDEQAYRFCPYSSNAYTITADSKVDEITDYNISIYNTMKNYFDLAIYVLKQDTGIYISRIEAKRLLDCYVSGEMYLYPWATIYNIPWMLMYFSPARKCYQMHIRKGSGLYQYFLTRDDIILDQYQDSEYYVVKNKPGSFLRLEYSMILHKRKIVDDEVIETISLEVFSYNKDNLPQTEYSETYTINEYRFPNLIQHAKYRDPSLLSIAEELMPEMERKS